MRFNEFTSNTVTEGYLDNPGAQDSPVASAITRRILLQRTDLLSKYGPEKVGAAVDEVADFVGDVDEIGSSDVSGWIRHVEQMLGNMGEGVAEGLGKNIKRAVAGWGAFDKDKPADVVKRVKGQDTATLKGLSNRGSTGKGSPAELQQKAISRELKKRGEQGVAEGDDIQYHQTSGTKAGHTISSRKLSNKPQASKSDVTLQSGSMHHSGKSYNFPKGTLFTQLPGGIFAQHPGVPETHPGFGHLIRKSEDNVHAIHNALTGVQGVTESSDELYGLRVGDTVKAVINGKRVQGNVIDIFPETMEVELLLRGANAGRTVTVDVRDTEALSEQGVVEGGFKNKTAVFSGYSNYMRSRAPNVFKQLDIKVLNKEYFEDEDIIEYTVISDGDSLAKARATLETNPQFGGMVLKKGVTEAGGRDSWDSNMPGYQGDYGGAENWGRRSREDDEHHEIDRKREQQLAQYNQTGKFWLKYKDSQKHVSAEHFIGKAAAVAAAQQMIRAKPEVKGNLLITAHGPNGE